MFGECRTSSLTALDALDQIDIVLAITPYGLGCLSQVRHAAFRREYRAAVGQMGIELAQLFGHAIGVRLARGQGVGQARDPHVSGKVVQLGDVEHALAPQTQGTDGPPPGAGNCQGKCQHQAETQTKLGPDTEILQHAF